VGTMAEAGSASPKRTSYKLGLPGSFFRPTPVVALPCGSESMSKTFRSLAAKAAARLIAVVVLPTPPFWLLTARTRLKRSY